MAKRNAPDATSCDYDAMLPKWEKTDTILAGQDAMRAAEETYLPRFPDETDDDYTYRNENAKFTNIYADIAGSLAAKPFTTPVHLAEGAGERFEKIAADIDGRGNNLNVFAEGVFFRGINYGVDWILVDYTKARKRPDGRPLSRQEEADQGLRPYWVPVPAKRLLDVCTDVIGGKEIITHARLREDVSRRDGFVEVTVRRIRVLNREPIFELDVEGAETDRVIGYMPATFDVWEQVSSGSRGRSSTWTIVESGPVTIGVIPLVPFLTGRRVEGSWQLTPPLQDIADLQVEHYQAETKLKCAEDRTAFPIIVAEGVAPPAQRDFTIGPGTILYAPPYGDTGQHGTWRFEEPAAESLKFLAEQVKTFEGQMRELGRQPLTATAGITVVTARLASMKASSTVQAWAWKLKDALEQAMVLTAMWLNVPPEQAPGMEVFTDFSQEAVSEQAPDVLLKMRDAGDLSQEGLWSEMKRLGILPSDFDEEAEAERLAGEQAEADKRAADAAKAASGGAADNNTPPEQQAAA